MGGLTILPLSEMLWRERLGQLLEWRIALVFLRPLTLDAHDAVVGELGIELSEMLLQEPLSAGPLPNSSFPTIFSWILPPMAHCSQAFRPRRWARWTVA